MIDGSGFVGVVYLQFDTVTVQPDIQSRVLVDVWRQADAPVAWAGPRATWASDTAVRAWVAVDHGHELPMLPNCAAVLSGPQLSEAVPMGQWTTLEVDVSGYSQATIKIGLEMADECALRGDCDAQLYIDNVRVMGGGEPRDGSEVWCPTMFEPQFTEESCRTVSMEGAGEAVAEEGSKSAAWILLVASVVLGIVGAMALANRPPAEEEQKAPEPLPDEFGAVENPVSMSRQYPQEHSRQQDVEAQELERFSADANDGSAVPPATAAHEPVTQHRPDKSDATMAQLPPLPAGQRYYEVAKVLQAGLVREGVFICVGEGGVQVYEGSTYDKTYQFEHLSHFGSYGAEEQTPPEEHTMISFTKAADGAVVQFATRPGDAAVVIKDMQTRASSLAKAQRDEKMAQQKEMIPPPLPGLPPVPAGQRYYPCEKLLRAGRTQKGMYLTVGEMGVQVYDGDKHFKNYNLHGLVAWGSHGDYEDTPQREHNHVTLTKAKDGKSTVYITPHAHGVVVEMSKRAKMLARQMKLDELAKSQTATPCPCPGPCPCLCAGH